MSTTAKILVTVKLDPIPGWGHKVEDFVAQLRDNSGIPHYIESVEVVPDPYEEMKDDDTPYGEGGPGSSSYFSFS